MWKFLIIVLGSAIYCGSVQASDEVEKLIEQWIKTEGLVAKEAAQWKKDQATISAVMKLHVKELELLNQELETIGAGAEKFTQQQQQLEKQKKASYHARKALLAHLQELQPRVVSLIKRFPVPLQLIVKEQAAVLNQKLDDKNSRTALQSVIKILQEADSFNRSFTENEHQILVGGKTLNADVIYIGLGRAIYKAGPSVGMGIPTFKGWIWTEKKELQSEITTAFKVQSKQQQATHFTLPLKVEEVKP